MKKLIAIVLVVTMVLCTGILSAAAAVPPPYNGVVDGTFIIDETTGAFTAELTGDYTVTITGFGMPDPVTANITNFVGTMTGDIESDTDGVVGKINANGQDSLFAVISGTGAAEPVYLMGDGKEFQDMKIVTGPLPDPVTDVEIGTVEGTTEVKVGGVLHMQLDSITHAGVYPDGDYEYLWGVYVNDSEYASIESDGTLHILAMPPDGDILMMVNTLDPNVYTENLSITVVEPETEVSGDVDPTYVIVIPASVDFGTMVKNSGVIDRDFPVEAKDVVLEDGHRISVSVTSDFEMLDGSGTGSTSLPYSLYNSNPSLITSGSVFTTFSGARTEEGTISVDTAGITKAGSYIGTMVFSIAYESE